MSDSRDTKVLRILYDNIETYIRNLKSLNITTDAYGTMLIPCIMQKLPQDIRLEITKNLVGDTWDFDQVLNIFNSQLTARENCYFLGKSENFAKNEFKQRPFLVTAATLITNDKRNPLQCIFCNQPHSMEL